MANMEQGRKVGQIIDCLYCGGEIVIPQSPDGLSPLQLLQGDGFIVQCPHCQERSPLRFTASICYDTRGGWPVKGWTRGGVTECGSGGCDAN